MKKIFVVLLVLLPFLGFTQVKLFTTDASKEYPDGTRITYFTVSDCPDDSGFLAYATDYILKDDRMIRFKIAKDGKSCFYEARKEVTEVMLVDLLNEAYYDFYSQTGEIPSSDPKEQSVSKSSAGSNPKEYKDDMSDSKELNSNSTARTFKKSDYNGKIYRVAFKIEDTPNLDNVKSATILLKEKGNFEEVFVNDNIHFELSSKEHISADFVIGIFEEFGLKIEEEFILDRF